MAATDEIIVAHRSGGGAEKLGTKSVAERPQPAVRKIHVLWGKKLGQSGSTGKTPLLQLRALVERVREAPGVQLYDAVEAGVPTDVVKMIARATGEPASVIMGLAGVSQTTFVRNEAANKPLPDVAGHRIMAYLRLLATLRRMLDESGDPEQMKTFDLEGWFARWVHEKLPELGDKTPADMLRNPEGQRAVEQVLERMRGGLAA
ncbi:UNVERIFIED_ORG: putative toxin-antitoxin system antitoxin component (TIGR02293 family) [Zoogloea ramigera]|uniref:Antitoxin Xre/MbcA/ParS toxin-binding domain-containing protein n=1 Tax=Duganella zoogloeoides TaxID=75659 RepID=A0ABZ0XR59_9BURK|nr:antitoxin Xre/MbcA/ParS toxin-binding domain-containing protein [Duganella zoogloeoides]WQH02215.1 antitoxin Xre/MbcA/ParS toxin-binding domain-containing protein [Duganella zoogloeoides]